MSDPSENTSNELVLELESPGPSPGAEPSSLAVRRGEIVFLGLERDRRRELLRRLITGYADTSRITIHRPSAPPFIYDSLHRPGALLGVWADRPPLAAATPREALRLAARSAGLRSSDYGEVLLEKLELGGPGGDLAGLTHHDGVRLSLALALVGEPLLLIADDPLAEVDTLTAGALLRLLDELLGESGCLYLHPPGRPPRSAGR